MRAGAEQSLGSGPHTRGWGRGGASNCFRHLPLLRSSSCQEGGGSPTCSVPLTGPKAPECTERLPGLRSQKHLHVPHSPGVAGPRPLGVRLVEDCSDLAWEAQTTVTPGGSTTQAS